MLIVVHFATKIIDWYNKKRFELYRNNSAEFISDLYKLKMKWAKRGEYMYAKAINSIIGAEMMEDEISGTPETEYGKDYLLKMKNLLDEEVMINAKKLE